MKKYKTIPPDRNVKLDQLMSTNFEQLDNQAALEHIAHLIDIGSHLCRTDAFELAFSLCERLDKKLPEADQALLDYYWGNAWEEYRIAKFGAVGANDCAWEQPDMAKSLFYLRRATQNPKFSSLPKLRQCQIQTNLANSLNKVGRVVEAIEHWNAALRLNKRFAMALGNRGIGLWMYAKSLYDQKQTLILLKFAHGDLTSALSTGMVWDNQGSKDGATPIFHRYLTQIEAGVVDIKSVLKNVELDNYSLGRSIAEQRYRQWCLKKCLFLNPLNDIGHHSIAACDPLILPEHVTETDTPIFVSFFNQIKQEYVSARYLCYEGITADKPHFSDKEVTILNTLDYPGYSLTEEKLRLAFRAAYSILDKIAFFLNAYFEFGRKPNKVNFRNVWYDGNVLRNALKSTVNQPLRGLFWLTKDLARHDADKSGAACDEVTEPDAEELKNIRDYLEHKCLKIHKESIRLSKDGELVLSLTSHDFQVKTIHMLKLARAALIYLSLGVHWVERKKRQESNGKISIPMQLPSIPDRWKR